MMGFKSNVEKLVSKIPYGRVMTYGQIAALCGSPLAARVVGGIAHYGNQDLPWQRVINKRGGLAAGYPGGRAAQRKYLLAEGIEFDGNVIKNIAEYLWWPKDEAIK